MSRQLTVRDVTADLYERLQVVAQSRGESLNRTVLAISSKRSAAMSVGGALSATPPGPKKKPANSIRTSLFSANKRFSMFGSRVSWRRAGAFSHRQLSRSANCSLKTTTSPRADPYLPAQPSPSRRLAAPVSETRDDLS
jgi:hypothetical protein